MRIDYVHIKSEFKNLEGFKINLPEDPANPPIVLLGPNATGKSNFIEALVLIFKYLDLGDKAKEKPPFSYEIHYECKKQNIKIRYEKGKYIYQVDEVLLKSKSEFNSRKNDLLPKYVFTYYSGVSNRLEKIFWEHMNLFYRKAIEENASQDDIDGLRRLFHVQHIHSLFVLLAYYSYDQDLETYEFLEKELKILDFESVLFALQIPEQWGKKGEPFWGAKGVVRDFLEKLRANSMAPILHDATIDIAFNKKPHKRQQHYLFLSNKEKLKQVASTYDGNNDFFKALETMYISDLIAEDGVRVKVKKRNVKGKITFRELSEGEQQLLTVLGLLKFTNDEESLVLLDEPDTHLNPLWKWKYLEFLEKVVKRPENTQIILSTHDPILIGSLKKEQIRLFRNRTDPEAPEKIKVFVEIPDIDPRGLGVAGILMSEMFGLPSILDKDTQEKLNRKRYLQGQKEVRELTSEEAFDFEKIRSELEEYGFYDQTNDPLYNKFLNKISKFEIFKKVEFTESEQKELDNLTEKILAELVEEIQSSNP